MGRIHVFWSKPKKQLEVQGRCVLEAVLWISALEPQLLSRYDRSSNMLLHSLSVGFCSKDLPNCGSRGLPSLFAYLSKTSPCSTAKMGATEFSSTIHRGTELHIFSPSQSLSTQWKHTLCTAQSTHLPVEQNTCSHIFWTHLQNSSLEKMFTLPPLNVWGFFHFSLQLGCYFMILPSRRPSQIHRPTKRNSFTPQWTITF